MNLSGAETLGKTPKYMSNFYKKYSGMDDGKTNYGKFKVFIPDLITFVNEPLDSWVIGI